MASLEKPRKIEETIGKMRKVQEGNSWKTVGIAGKGLKKRHEMEERQSFEKTTRQFSYIFEVAAQLCEFVRNFTR